MTSMFEELKVEFRSALQREEPQDATRRQHIMLQMLEDIRSGVAEGMVQNYNTRIGDLFVSCQKWQRARAGFKVACTTADAAHTSEAMHEKAQWIL